MFVFKTIWSFLKDEDYRHLLYATGIMAGIGSVVYHYVEGWSWIDSVYFSIITLTTVGYGDFSPATDVGKLFTIFYIFMGIGIILSFVEAVYTHYNNEKNRNRDNQKPMF